MSEFQIDDFVSDATECTFTARIPADLRYFEGHFEGDPIVPGIAQLLPLIWEPARRAWPDLPAPRAVTRLKFLGALRPGHEVTVTLERSEGGVGFEVRREGQVCTRGKLAL